MPNLLPRSASPRAQLFRFFLIAGIAGLSARMGDVLLGTNPVDSTIENIANLERALGDVVRTFGLDPLFSPHLWELFSLFYFFVKDGY